jgi:hypothetical protein
MGDGVALTIGHLRDPIRQRVLGVKLFRTACFERVQYPDTVCASTDFVAALLAAGWGRTYALRHSGESRHWHTLGEHRPRYDSPEYTYRKFLIEGARCRYRRAEGRFAFMLNELRASSHPAAVLATIALAHGLFVNAQHDLLSPGFASDDAIFLAEFLGECALGGGAAHVSLADGAPGDAFVAAYLLGARLRRARDAPTFLATLARLRRESDLSVLVRLIGLCHGLFAAHATAVDAERAFADLAPLLIDAHRSW